MTGHSRVTVTRALPESILQRGSATPSPYLAPPMQNPPAAPASLPSQMCQVLEVHISRPMGRASCSHTPHPQVQARSACLRCTIRPVVRHPVAGSLKPSNCTCQRHCRVGLGGVGGQVPGTPAEIAHQGQSLLHPRGTLSQCHKATGSLDCQIPPWRPWAETWARSAPPPKHPRQSSLPGSRGWGPPEQGGARGTGHDFQAPPLGEGVSVPASSAHGPIPFPGHRPREGRGLAQGHTVVWTGAADVPPQHTPLGPVAPNPQAGRLRRPRGPRPRREPDLPPPPHHPVRGRRRPRLGEAPPSAGA